MQSHRFMTERLVGRRQGRRGVHRWLSLAVSLAGRQFFRRNRPGLYRPEALPAEMMPRGWWLS
jgi:hypothetical protein